MTLLTVAKAPCKSCPYRKDVPSGVWSADEYVKLPTYDGNMAEQGMTGGAPRFDCHQQDGKLCAGWVGCHGADNLLSLRLISLYSETLEIDPEVWNYKSPVPLFKSGAEAAAHGRKAIKRPGVRARRTIDQLVRKHRRHGGSV